MHDHHFPSSLHLLLIDRGRFSRCWCFKSYNVLESDNSLIDYGIVTNFEKVGKLVDNLSNSVFIDGFLESDQAQVLNCFNFDWGLLGAS